MLTHSSFGLYDSSVSVVFFTVNLLKFACLIHVHCRRTSCVVGMELLEIPVVGFCPLLMVIEMSGKFVDPSNDFLLCYMWMICPVSMTIVSFSICFAIMHCTRNRHMRQY